MGTLPKFYEDISLNVTADKSNKNFHLVSRRLFIAEVFLKHFSIETNKVNCGMVALVMVMVVMLVLVEIEKRKHKRWKKEVCACIRCSPLSVWFASIRVMNILLLSYGYHLTIMK